MKLIPVTDHAVVRYFERVWHLDMKLVRSTICPPHLSPLIHSIGSGELMISNSHIIVIDNTRIVTVLPSKEGEGL